MSDGPRFPASVAEAVVRELLPRLLPACLPNPDDPKGRPWLKVAGSLRRKRATVGDVEIVYCAQWGRARRPGSLFEEELNLADLALEQLVLDRVIAPRPSRTGSTAWGPQNKLAVHCESGLPVDFFAIPRAAFWNYLVCRTGPKEFNVALASRAQERGLTWHPYHGGFQVVDAERAAAATGRADLYTGRMLVAQSEADVLALAGLPWIEPRDRDGTLTPRGARLPRDADDTIEPDDDDDTDAPIEHADDDLDPAESFTLPTP